jgi:hypothetical protein
VKKPSPKVVWANGVNSAGLYSNKPIRCAWHESGVSSAYWDRTGNFDVTRLGLKKGPMDTFASHDRRDVELWTAGARAILDRLREWVGPA